MKRTTRKSGLLLMVGLLLFTFGLWDRPISVQAQNEQIIIKDILAHDSVGKTWGSEPKTLAEVKNLMATEPPHRTGWSAAIFVCDTKNNYDAMGQNILPWNSSGGNNHWRQEKRINTDDSGRDKKYLVSEYRDEIVKKYGNDKYEKALASGKNLVYQDGSKREIYGKDTRGELTPCKDGVEAYFYNNLDFDLTLTFTVGGLIPPPVGGSCQAPNENVPKRYEHELDVEVSRIDARTVNLNALTETDVYVSRESFASSRQAAKAEFDAYIKESESMKTECESLIKTWESEIADLESQKAICEAFDPGEVPEGEEAPEPPDCSSFDEDIAQYEDQIAEAKTVIKKYNELIGKAKTELSYIQSNESNYSVVTPKVQLKYDGSNISSVSVSLQEGQSMVRYTFPEWRVTEQGKDIVAQINESGPYQEFQYTNLSSRSAQSLGYNSSLGNVLYPNKSSNNWKDTKQYVATYVGASCSVSNPKDFFKTQTTEGIVRTVNENGSKRDIKETLTSNFTKLPRTEMRAGYGFDYVLSTTYRNHDTEYNSSNASGTKRVESYFPNLVNYLPYVRGGSKPTFDLNGNSIPLSGIDEGYRVINETTQPSVPRNETKSWILPPVAIEAYSGNIFAVNNKDYLNHPKRNQNEDLITTDASGKPLTQWFVDFKEPDGYYQFMVRTYDAGVNHLNTCHNGQVLVEGSFIGDPNGNDDFVFRPIEPANSFPGGTGWNWLGREGMLTTLSDWWQEWLYPNPKDVPKGYHEDKYELPRSIIDEIRKDNDVSPYNNVLYDDSFMNKYNF